MLRQIVGNAVCGPVFGIIRLYWHLLMPLSGKIHNLKEPGQNIQINACAVIAGAIGKPVTDASEQGKDQNPLFFVRW